MFRIILISRVISICSQNISRIIYLSLRLNLLFKYSYDFKFNNFALSFFLYYFFFFNRFKGVYLLFLLLFVMKAFNRHNQFF